MIFLIVSNEENKNSALEMYKKLNKLVLKKRGEKLAGQTCV